MNPNPIAFELFGRPVYWYGVIIAVGVLVGIYLAMRYAKLLKYDPEMMVDFCLLAIPLAIIGARLYYVIFKWEVYKDYPLDIIKIWEGGLAIYGAVIGGVIAGVIFSRWRKVQFWDLADIVAPSLILGQAIGRWGNFFNQEAYGRAVTNKTWQWFPYAVYIEAEKQWHMATFFYESMWNILVFVFLMFYRRRRKKSGEVFLLYLILYSSGRIVIEGLRTDSLYWGSFRVSQIVAALLIIVGLILFIIRRRKEEPSLLDELPVAETHLPSDEREEEDVLPENQPLIEEEESIDKRED